MSDQQQGTDPYSAVIADLKAKRDQIDMTIKNLELLRGGSRTQAAPPSSAASTNGTADGGVVETAGMFLGMSIVDAAKKLLNLRKRTMSNSEILAELKSGGLVLTGADPLNVVGSVLTRRFNKVGDVVRVGRGIWGLKEWYPGRNFKPTKVSGSEAGADDIDSPAPETEEEANQRVIDELEARRVATGRAVF